MIDDTTRIERTGEPGKSTPYEQLRQLTLTVSALTDALREYGTSLRGRGMNLPAGTLEGLRLAQTALDEMQAIVSASAIELRQLRALAETTALFKTAQSVEDVLQNVMDTVIQLTGAERGFILLKDEAGELQFRTARGIDREQLDRADFTISRTIIGEVARTGQSVRTDNARDDPRFSENASIVNYNLRSILAVPLRVQGEVIGVVYCDNRVVSGLFKAHDLNILSAFADQAAVAIQNARLFTAARAQLAEITAMRDLMDSTFASIASGLIALDTEHVITAFNPTAETIIGVRRQEAIGARFTDVLPEIAKALEDAVAQGYNNQPTSLETSLLMPTGGASGEPLLEQRILSASISPLRDESEIEARGIVIVLDDLTEQRQREAQLAQVRRYLPSALVENIRSEDLAALGGQERMITALFADVRGFTSFSELLEPETLMTIINQYLAVASDSINLFDGVVDKYLGDAVTGLFNTQLNPQADHAVRAVRAALSMRYDIEALHEVLPPDQRLLFGVGIHTGMAVLGNVGSRERREFAAIGDAVDLSKLLQENAARGEVLLSEATYQLVAESFECEPLTPRKTKGRPDFTVMYRVKGIKRRTQELDRS